MITDEQGKIAKSRDERVRIYGNNKKKLFLIRSKFPAVHKHVESFGMPWALVCSKWFVCLYSDVLPIETTLRVWDCLFYEGSKILLRVALALVALNEKEILATTEFADLANKFQSCTISEETTFCHEFIEVQI